MSTEATGAERGAERHRMVEEQLRVRGITDTRVLSAMETVPRHLFVPPPHTRSAYEDGPLPIGFGQTISQPYMVARMTELLALDEGSRVLEIGTGSGYQTAVLAELAAQVITVERVPELATRAMTALRERGYTNVTVITADGSLGHPERAPYDAILVTAAAPQVPPTLREQLALGGRMVIPVATEGPSQELLLVERPGEEGTVDDPGSASAHPMYRETRILACVFVPLVGEEGYSG